MTDAAQRLATLQQILERVKTQQKAVQAALDRFYALPYREQSDYLALNSTVKETLDTILAAQDWQDSFFLRSTLKPLQQLHERVAELQSRLLEEIKSKEEGGALKETQIPVFLSLYQAKGDQLSQWETLLRSLSRHTQGRPIYKERTFVEKLLRSKPNPIPEAYVVVAIEQKDILPETREDRLGSPVLTVKEGAIQSENIVEFVHMGKQYLWQHNQLILKP